MLPMIASDLLVGLGQAQMPGQPQADQALAEHMFHRLAHAQVGGQRQDGKQLGHSHIRTGHWLGHGYEYTQLDQASPGFVRRTGDDYRGGRPSQETQPNGGP